MDDGHPITFFLVTLAYAVSGGAFWFVDRFDAWWSYAVSGLAVALVSALAVAKDLHDLKRDRHVPTS